MRYLKKFESIHFLDYAPERGNTLEEVFGIDLYKFKEFLQNTLPNQNLLFVGAGTKGITFKWLGNRNLPTNFYDNQFTGNRNYTTDLVIKITPYEPEVAAAHKILQRAGAGQLPGFVKIYWIKEVELPKEFQWSKRVGPIEYDDLEYYSKYVKKNPQIEVDKKGFRKWRTRWIDEDKIDKKDKSKDSKVWLICQELLQLPTEREKFILEEITLLSRAKVAKVKPDDKKILQNIFKKEISEMDIPGEPDINFEEFENLFWKFFNITQSAKKYGIPNNDFDASNFGFRGQELVAFDCA